MKAIFMCLFIGGFMTSPIIASAETAKAGDLFKGNEPIAPE